MVTVGVDPRVVERRLVAGRLRCPGCSGRLAGWGHARQWVIRGMGGIGWRLRPRRSRCAGCGVTHVPLPVNCLLRRADGAVVIWAGLAASAAGVGYRKIASGLGCPASTVAGWPGSGQGPGWSRHQAERPRTPVPRRVAQEQPQQPKRRVCRGCPQPARQSGHTGSKNPDGPKLLVSPAKWHAFVPALKMSSIS